MSTSNKPGLPAKMLTKAMNNLDESHFRKLFMTVSDITRFIWRIIVEMVKPPYEFREIMKQCFLVGNKSLGLIATTGFIMGLVLTIQSRPTLAEFGAESWLPAMVSVSIVREIGPVITALICAGKVGSGIGAELASMRVTEQIDAMEVSGINPFKYVIVTRVIATTLMIPVLVVFSDTVSLLGSWVGVNIQGDVSGRLFFYQAFQRLEFSDIIPSIVKSVFFGFAIGVIACYKGYYSDKGTAGVGLSANAAVVAASLMIFILDMLAVQVTNLFI